MPQTRRTFLLNAAALAAPAQSRPTQFQIGCMTLPYGAFPFARAIQGLAASGNKYVGWGPAHERKPTIEPDAPAAAAKPLAQQTRDLGLTPVLMFAGIYIDHADSIKVHTRRIEQAAAAGIPFLITFGHTATGAYDLWVRNLKTLGPIARANKVTITVKQHGGLSATGAMISKLLADVADDGVKMCYDGGNVLDYESTNPIPDIQACWRDVRLFAIKDHRDTPKDQDCGPGFGEVDHYKLLLPVLTTGLTIPLICENIFEPLVDRPTDPAGIDRLAARAREYMETVVRGLTAHAAPPK
ncbi:MAG: sugar phosphate isomerase/epimerase [Acidobacteria bacterium]|nr:sugar phosphate isomerase/epimerase [Acidobacteriota bacterium]